MAPAIDVDGVPDYLFILLRKWKGAILKTCLLQVHRNKVDLRLCPVVALLEFKAVLKIRTGALFLLIL